MRRTIIVGDVHGCGRELDQLLDRVAPTGDDRLVFVGDLVAKGPDSLRVLRLARELGAGVTLGNHEERLLDARAARRAGRALPKLGGTHVRLLDELEDEDWAMLEAMPRWLDVDAQLRVVHGGVMPGVPMEAQDPRLLTHLRAIAEDGTPSIKFGPLWGLRYAGPPHVVFGHNAAHAPQLHPAATGLDTGCVYGGELTALVLPADSEPPPPADRRDALVVQPAAKAYSDYGGPLPRH